MEQMRVHFCFLWLLVVAALGCVLRIYPVTDISLDYKNILHAHSHVAFLGWVFTSLFTLIGIIFLKDTRKNNKQFTIQFVTAQVAVTGMLLAFLYQGYGPISIFFSALHMTVSIWFAVSVYQACKPAKDQASPLSIKFLFSAIAFMVLSSLGPLSLPVISKALGSASHLYSNAIYFYLHFQYNGWFIFTLLAFLFKKLEDNGVKYSLYNATVFYRSMLISCGLSFFLSILWSGPAPIIWIAGGTGAILQCVALVSFFIFLKQLKWKTTGILRILALCILTAFTLKIVLQLLSAFPLFAGMASSFRGFIIAYLHLVVLGIVSLSLFAGFITSNLIDPRKRSGNTGILLFISGFALSEVLTIVQAFANFYSVSIGYYNYLQIFSALIIITGVLFTYSGRNTLIKLNIQRINFNSINIINKSKLPS
jgi:hypothetical protein